MYFVNGKYANGYIDKLFYKDGKLADWWCDDGDVYKRQGFTESSTILTVFLMFIGGSPASTAGGIKTTTIFLLIVTTISFIQNNNEIEVFKRRISFSLVKRAIGIFVISLLLVNTVVFVLTLIEDVQFIDLLFETISAFATVGLSKDLTPHLKDITKVFIIILMFRCV